MSLWVFLKYTGVITLVLIISFVSFMYLSYINETITDGEGYGFTIGMTKEAAFKSAKTMYQQEDLFVVYISSYDKSISFIEPMNFTDKDFEKLQSYDVWPFFYGRNSIDLTFSNSALVEIHRHRQYFELP